MARLQEAQFACFEADDWAATSGNEDAAARGDRSSFRIALPSGVQASRSAARVRSVECSGSGNFYFQQKQLKDRFVCWRVIKNTVIFREWSLHETLSDNVLRLQFPAPVVPTGVYTVESWDGANVTVGVVTYAGSVHRFRFAIPTTPSQSLFTNTDARFPPQPAAESRCDMLTSLASDEVITVATWVNEYNLVVATDSGRVLGVNFGHPTAATTYGEVLEFAFSDESVVKWLWNGLVKSRSKWQQDDSQRRASGIVAVTSFPFESEDNEADDVCIVTLSGDFTLQAWSYSSQSCLGKQQIRGLLNLGNTDDQDCYANQAKIVALPRTATDNCRLLVHVDTSLSHSQQVFLLRGEIMGTPAPGGNNDLELEVGRIFGIDANDSSSTRRLKMVDFALDKNYLYSCWRSTTGDSVFSHPNPMASTGPRVVHGQRISCLNDQMDQYSNEDNQWSFDLHEEGVAALIDNFFIERILLPGRFSRQNLFKAIQEYHGDLDFSLRPLFAQADHQQSKYKGLLVNVVSEKWLQSVGGRKHDMKKDPNLLRIGIWKDIIELCIKHWRCENVPIGFAATAQSMLPGSPIMLRRNRVCLLVPSASSITSVLRSNVDTTNAQYVRDILGDVLPIFDAFPSHSFQSFIDREVTDVVSDWKVQSFVALARQCVRLGLKSSSHARDTYEVSLTRAVLRLSKILGGDSALHNQVFGDLVKHIFPYDDSLVQDNLGSTLNEGSQGENKDDDDDDNAMDGTTTGFCSSPLERSLFGGSEACFAFDQVASRTIEQMCSQALRVVLLMAYLIESQPAFLDSVILRKVLQVYLPKSITIYQRWRLSRWISTQNIVQPTELDIASLKSSVTLMTPIFQQFLLESNDHLNKSDAFQRSRSMMQVSAMNNSVTSEDAQGLLASFTREILQYVSQPTEILVQFLQKRKQFSLLRAMFCCSLSDVSLHDVKSEYSEQPQVQRYVRSIGECLAYEGQVAVRADDKEHAKWCFQQSVRCFDICLSSFMAKNVHAHDEEAAEQFIYEVVGLLKETFPRGFYDQMLVFLWAVATQALGGRRTSGIPSIALQSFVWVNVFKYSVEERSFRDAHLALMHTLELVKLPSSTSIMNEDNAQDAEDRNELLTTSVECVNYFVKELLRYGHLDLICDFQWGILEADVEKQIQWHAANANVIKDGCVDPSLTRYHNLLFAFYTRKKQPAHAAASMHSLFLRLRLAKIRSRVGLQTQRDALYAASNALLALPKENRWIVRKYHTEELLRAVVQNDSAKNGLPLNMVTLDEIEQEIASLDGKLRLLYLGHQENVLLSTMDAKEVISLLVDTVHSSTEWTKTTKAEQRQECLLSMEMAVHISKTWSSGYGQITKSLARYCVSTVHVHGAEGLCWDMLHVVLTAMNSLEQYEIAAETILSWQMKLVLPRWLYQRLSDPNTGNPAKLLTLYLQHGLLIEAVDLVNEIIPSDRVLEQESSFMQRASALSPERLPWIPYNLVDTVLDSAEAVIATRGAASGPSEMTLRTGVQQIRHKLTAYSKYVNALEQAHEAALVARHAATSVGNTVR